jgi:predicted aspartyl protease
MADMAILRIRIEVSSLPNPEHRVAVEDVMVDTGSELTWIPRTVLEALGLQPVKTMRFRTANGKVVKRQVAEGRLHAAGESAPDWVVFAEPTDMRLLGARTLEGMNLRVDLLSRQLVPAGPMPAAAA